MNNVAASLGLAENLLEELKQSYLANLPSRVDDIESLVLALERGDDYKETYEALYRAVHSLKGSAGTYGFPIVTGVCHQFEDYLTFADHLCAHGGKMEVDIMLGYIDILREMSVSAERATKRFSHVEAALLALKNRATSNNLSGLIVESSALNAGIIKDILTAFPVHVSVVKDGITALHRLMTETFDFIITSQEVGDLNGTAMVAALRLSRSVNRNSKVILLTSNKVEPLPEKFRPNVVVTKDAHIQENLQAAMTRLFF